MTDIQLFDYQEDMVRRVQETFEHHDAVMVQMPTGTGKTHVLAAIVGSFLKKKVWVVAHRRELVSQIRDTLGSFFPAWERERIRMTSIQWLSRHHRELDEKPGLIVIDEAHHALAETYAEVMNAYPKAKKLGLTATPCRLNGKGFTDLFDTLLCSWSMERFIAEGRLSLYDYYSIKPGSADQQLIDSLRKRGADGDYQQKELCEVMDVRPSLERLCLTIQQYVPEKKGIVYAINIQHAEHIAEFYRENGIQAMAISSKTPLAERQALIGKFRNARVAHDIPPNTNGTNNTNVSDEIQVLVSVDLFSEGFDCPDVEFIQLARPTLSLAKYMQMVGRGLRVAQGKAYCVILDNVGLYRRFGLPSASRDWQSMFAGRTSQETVLQAARLCASVHCRYTDALSCDDREMVKLVGHEHLQPQLAGIDFRTSDGKRLYPRVHSRFVDETAFLTLKTLELQVGTGLLWKGRFIPWDEPSHVYMCLARQGRSRLYTDEDGNLFAQENLGSPLVKVDSPEGLAVVARRDSSQRAAALQARAQAYEHGEFYPASFIAAFLARGGKAYDGLQEEDDGLLHVAGDCFHESYWVDPVTHRKHYTRPFLLRRGFVNILKEGDWCYIRNIPGLKHKPLRQWEIVADDNICVINNEFLFVKEEPRICFKICIRTDDFTYFVVKEYDEHKNMDQQEEIQITQFEGEGVNITYKDGRPYPFPLPRHGCA